MRKIDVVEIDMYISELYKEIADLEKEIKSQGYDEIDRKANQRTIAVLDAKVGCLRSVIERLRKISGYA